MDDNFGEWVKSIAVFTWAPAGLYTGFLPRGGKLGVCQKEGGARLFVATGQPQGGGGIQGGANLEYVKKRGGEAVRSCRAATGGGGIQGGARITQGGANAPAPPKYTPESCIRIDPVHM